MKNSRFTGTIILITSLAALCVLSFSGSGKAAPQAGQQPFTNAVEQRNQMIQELQEIKDLLRVQNALLRELVGKSNAPGKATKAGNATKP